MAHFGSSLLAVVASISVTLATAREPVARAPQPQCAAPPQPTRRPEPGLDCGTARFWTDGSTGRNWAEARAMCRSLGGDLASIHTEAERVCANRVLAQLGSPGVGAWIGLAEDQQEGAWRWADGSPNDFASWLPGEPSDDSGSPNDCGHIWRDRAFSWNDIPCTRTDPSYLCRLP